MAEFYWDVFLSEFCLHSPLLLVLIVVSVVLCGGLRSMGLPYLFWHQHLHVRFLAGLAVSLLIVEIFFAGYLLDTPTLDLTHHEELFSWAGREHAVWYTVGCGLSFSLTFSLFAVVLLRKWAGDAEDRQRFFAVLPFFAGLLVGLGGLFVLYSIVPPLPSASITGILSWGVEPGLSDAQVPDHLFALGLALGFFVLIVVARWLFNRVAAALSVCALLGFVVASYGWFSFRAPGEFVVLIFAGLLFLGGIPRYKLRLQALRSRYRRRGLVKLEVGWGRAEETALSSQRNREAQAEGQPAPKRDADKPPLILVAVSGGGLRAAAWTNAVLSELEQKRVLAPGQVALIAGASGGMLGATFWAASLEDPGQEFQGPSAPARRWWHGCEREDLQNAVEKDKLSNLAHRLVSHDLWRAFCPMPSYKSRGAQLEETFKKHYEEAFKQARKDGTPHPAASAHTLGDMREGERAGWRPTLIYSPMLVEDGQRLLISNMGLEFVATSRGTHLPEHPGALLSRNALEFRELFSDEEVGEFSVWTAARLSASFPYITPAPCLPTAPRRRVVDAGYYDNFGVNILAAFLADCLKDSERREWLEGFGRVLLIQIRDGVLSWSRKQAPRPEQDAWWRSWMRRSFEWSTSPPEALLSARNAAAVYRNDEQVETLDDLLGDFFATTSIELAKPVALSWSLAQFERNLISAEAHREVEERKDALVNFLGAPRNEPSHQRTPRPEWWWRSRAEELALLTAT